LDSGSPVFFGRRRELDETLAVLRRPDNPGCVSVLGERRFGKSSFLEQVYGALAAEPGLVSIHATTQDWTDACPERFFAELSLAIRRALDATAKGPSPAPEASARSAGGQSEVRDYPTFRDQARGLARKGLRFVLLLDELEQITGVQPFDAEFFTNLRALAGGHPYRFGILVASHRPLKELSRDRRIAASKFWNIFGFSQYLGLLDKADAVALATEPFKRSLPKSRRPDLDALWTDEVAPLAGRHPALIQMLLFHHWNACRNGYEPNLDQLQMGLREYLEDLWCHRHGKEEWRVLIQAANGEDRAEDAMLQNLRLRGLVTPDNRPFSPLFARLIPELMPEGISFAEAVEKLRKGARGQPLSWRPSNALRAPAGVWCGPSRAWARTPAPKTGTPSDPNSGGRLRAAPHVGMAADLLAASIRDR
jgi:hypothetical protein